MSNSMREDWEECTFGEIAIIYNGDSINAQIKKDKYQKITTGLNYIGTKDIDYDGTINYINGVKIPTNENKFKIAPKGCVLVCSEGGSAGRKTAYVDEDICFGNKLYAITNEYSAFGGKYIYYYTRFRKFFEDFKNKMNGIIGGVSANKFSEIPFPLSPLPIQRAIVAKIEVLFSDLDNGIANFKKAQEQLKTYRQAVLKKAFEGGFSITNEELRITEAIDNDEIEITDSITNEELRITNEKNQSNHTNQKNYSSDNLPKGWKWVKISDVCDMKAGYFIKADEINSEFENGLFPCYGGNGLRGYVKSTTHEGLFSIVGRQGALCGNVHLVNGKFHATEHAVVVTAKKEIDIKCLYYKLKEMKINQYATGTAQPGLSVNKILPIEIIYPSSLGEQAQIVQEIESRLSVTDNLEFVIRNSIEKAEALRQSILKKAFEGKLLSIAEIELCKKETDYEPASELLKKITNEKLRITNEKTKRKTRNS